MTINSLVSAPARSADMSPPATAKPLPSLENGDHLSASEFERRYEAMPHLKKAELIEGRVYIPILVANREGVFLEHGMHLSDEEFLQRYEALPGVKKAELIEGVVYMPSPVRHSTHGLPHAQVMGWLVNYWASTPGIEVSDNVTLRLAAGVIPQPDAVVRIAAMDLGTSTLDENGYLRGAPELIVEIAGSSAAYDLHEKLAVYQSHGVQEYIVWQVHEQEIIWLHLENGAYRPLPVDEDGLIRSQVFPGLWLAVDAMLTGDLSTVLAAVQEGLRSAEHARFVQQLDRTE
jgi:Uma2 family endonuclease